MKFKKLWSVGTDADYEPSKTAEILDAFNRATQCLYFLSGEEKYIEEVLNASTPEMAEYKRLIKSIGDLAEVADTLEMARNIIFGGAIDWEYIFAGLKKLAKEKEEPNEI